MSSVRHIGVSGGAESPDNVQQIVEVARDALNHEVARAERYDAKARNQMTLAGSWFAVAQAIAAVAVTSSTPTGWIGAILLAAVVAAVFLILAMIGSAQVWKLRDEPAISHETLEAMLSTARKSPATFGEKLVQEYQHLLGHVQDRNEERATALDNSVRSWWYALGFGFIEICVALLSRVVGA